MRAGDPPRSRRIHRLIATERALRGVFLVGAGIYLLFHPGRDFGRLAEPDVRRGHRRGA